MTIKKVELSEITELERENTRLKGIVGAYDRQTLLQVRAIQLRNENKCLQDIADEIKRLQR